MLGFDVLARDRVEIHHLNHRPVSPVALGRFASMQPRFYSERPITGSEVRLSGDEAHHLLHVRRMQAGAQVRLFDGSGSEFPAEVIAADRREVLLHVGEGEFIDRELPLEVTLAVPLPKGDRQQFLVEKCVELGVCELIPLRTHFSVAEPGEGACRRMRRWVVEASKQCGRNRLMRIGTPQSLIEVLSRAVDAREARWFLDETNSEMGHFAVPRISASRVVAAIGPEAGWDQNERRAALDHNWLPVSLGQRILRVETAAVVIAAWCGLPHNDER